MRRMPLSAGAGLAAALALLLLPAVAPAKSLVLDRKEVKDNTVFEVTTKSALKKGKAVFSLTGEPSEDGDDDSPYDPEAPITQAPLKLAGPSVLVLGSGLACADPSATSVYGTVTRSARRVVATLANGRRVHVPLEEPPEKWNFKGWVLGKLLSGRRVVDTVRAYDKRGKRIAFARFTDTNDC